MVNLISVIPTPQVSGVTVDVFGIDISGRMAALEFQLINLRLLNMFLNQGLHSV